MPAALPPRIFQMHLRSRLLRVRHHRMGADLKGCVLVAALWLAALAPPMAFAQAGASPDAEAAFLSFIAARYANVKLDAVAAESEAAINLLNRHPDQALHEAKQQGRNRVVVAAQAD